jgi:hypothetical protein
MIKYYVFDERFIQIIHTSGRMKAYELCFQVTYDVRCFLEWTGIELLR